MEPTHSTEARLSALERRVAELEAAALPEREGAKTAALPGPKGAKPAPTTQATGASSAADRSPADADSAPALPGDKNTFWALHGLVDHLGDGVTYTGYTTPPGAEAPVAWQMGLSNRGLQKIDFAEAAGSLAALGHPVRLQLLQAIYEGTSTVAELGKDERFGTSGQIYHHVHALAGAGWLESARRGHWRVPAQRIVPLLTLVLIGTH